MLWLCLSPTRLCLECLHAAADSESGGEAALAVVQSRGARRWIVDSDTDLAPGIDVGAALALKQLRLVERDPSAEREALQQLAYLAYRFGQPVHLYRTDDGKSGELPIHAVLVEVSRSLALFAGLPRLLEKLQSAVAEVGLTVRCGVAPTLEGAHLAARESAVLDAKTFRPWLQQQPLAALRLPASVRSVLVGSGLRTIGEVIHLDVASLARRFGTEATGYLKRLTGDLPDPRRSVVPPSSFHRRFELMGRVDTVDLLLLPLRRLLVELEHYLRARDIGVLQFSIELSHEGGKYSVLDVGLSAASRDANHFLLVARERLERTPLKGPVIEIRLKAERFDAAEVPQYDLFDKEGDRQRDWQVLLERLIARWGSEAVWSLGLVADHRPEKSWKKVAPGSAAADVECGPRPNWLLKKPRPIERPNVVGEPERIEAGWWSGGVGRDYFVAQGKGGTRLWVYRDHQERRWYLHGLFA